MSSDRLHEIECLAGEWEPQDLPSLDLGLPEISQEEVVEFAEKHPAATNHAFHAIRYLYSNGTPHHIDSLWASSIADALNNAQEVVLAGESQMRGKDPFVAAQMGANTMLHAVRTMSPETFATAFRAIHTCWAPHYPTAIPTAHVSHRPMLEDDATPGLVWEVNPKAWVAAAKMLAEALAYGQVLEVLPASDVHAVPAPGEAYGAMWSMALSWAKVDALHPVACYNMLAGVAARLTYSDALLYHPSAAGRPWKPAPGGIRLEVSVTVSENSKAFSLVAAKHSEDVRVVDIGVMFPTTQEPEA